MWHALRMTTGIDDADGFVIPTWSFADKVRKSRATVGMDQRAFADALNVKPGSLAGWESGKSKPRDVVAIAKRIELLTRVPASWLLGLESESPRPGPDGGQGAPSRARTEDLRIKSP